MSATGQPFTEKRALRITRGVLRVLKVQRASIGLFFVDASLMRRLGKRLSGPRHRHVVLAFPEPAAFPHPETKARVLGEIYLDRNIARRAPERATFLLIHGILHLLGYRHSRKNDTIQMERMEKKIWDRVT